MIAHATLPMPLASCTSWQLSSGAELGGAMACSTCFRIIGDEEVLYEMNLHLPPGGAAADAPAQTLQAPGQSPSLAQAFAGHHTPPGPALSALPAG